MKRTYISPVTGICHVSTGQLMLTASGMPTVSTQDADDSQVFSRESGHTLWDDDE